MGNHHRSVLEVMSSDRWQNIAIRITHSSESRPYTLRSVRGHGQTGVTWKADDQFGRNWAIKFVIKKDYVEHSLDAEIRRVAQLNSDHIAKLHFFGQPESCLDIPLDDFYAIVGEWIDGQSLLCFLDENHSRITIETCLTLIRGLCDVVAELRQHELSHNDLHDRNIMIVRPRRLISGTEDMSIKVIDTGALKDEQRRLTLIEKWGDELRTLLRIPDSASKELSDEINSLRNRIDWFSRRDEEWIVYHLCGILNCIIERFPTLETTDRRFLRGVRSAINLMTDPDPSRRLTDPSQIYGELIRRFEDSRRVQNPTMTSPFDLMSAELFRDDRHLMTLFSEKFPGLDTCRSNDPVYVYGPRGCGKSTVFRSLSLKTILQSGNIEDELSKVPFIGVYVSCTSELRSRFWLLSNKDFDALESLIVRYFNLILVEELVRTLVVMAQWDKNAGNNVYFGVLSSSIKIAETIARCVGLPEIPTSYDEISALEGIRWEIRLARDQTWGRILRRERCDELTNAQLIFDVCEQMADICPTFQHRRIAFLLDDYSNQRIRPELQTRLNQAITFAKQGNPIFKVTSEYEGVDLTGIQEGREVREVNVGLQHTELRGKTRHRFLQSILQTRFNHLGVDVPIEEILPPSGIGPSIPLAVAIRDGSAGGTFKYHGIDTISDICSGDFATALDLVRRIFEIGNVDWRQPATPISENVQHRAIGVFSEGELQKVRYLSPLGQKKFEIIERLCWMARECVISRTTRKEGNEIPLIKIHLDVSESAIRGIRNNSPEYGELFDDLVRKGVLFPVGGSRDREHHEGTRRFQIRRVLLTKYPSALGRHTPIRIRDEQRLLYLLTEPQKFVDGELIAGDRANGDLFE